MVKKRKWKSEELGPRHVKGKYLAPVVDVPNGHAVMREDGTVQVAAYVLHHWKPLPEPVDGWQFVERRGDEGEEREPEEPYRVRRRIRDKTQKKVLEDEGVLVRLRALRSTIEEEEKAVTNDEPEVMDIVVKALEGLKKEEEELRSSTEVEKDEEQILQTKIVSAKEVEMNLEDWKAPMKKELDTIVEEKGAITRLNPASTRELLENNPRVQVLPGKGVFTIKPGRKRKCRLVVCGNYGESHEAMPLFAGGTDVVALRLALKEAAVRGWQGGTVDVKGAFLNAPLQAVDQHGGHATAGSTGPDGVDTQTGAVDRQQGNVRPTAESEVLVGLPGRRDEEVENQLWQALAEVGTDEERTESVAGEEGRGRLESRGAGRPTTSLRDAVRRGRSASSPHQGHVGIIRGELVRQGAGKVLRGEHLCDGAGDHLGPDGLHQGDHRSEQCHWQVGDPHEQGVQRARGRDRDHGGGDSDGSAPGGRVNLAGHPEQA